MNRVRDHGVLANAELASRLPEYGADAIDNLTDDDLLTLYVNVERSRRMRKLGDNPVVATYRFTAKDRSRWIIRSYFNNTVDAVADEGLGLTPAFKPGRAGERQYAKVEQFINRPR
jgi:hypothetical protein